MPETILQFAGSALFIAGVVVAWYYGWRGMPSTHRRCPQCLYDMSATTGLRCSECGFEARNEARLYRAFLRRRAIVVGACLVIAAYPLTRAVRVYNDGIVGFLPRAAVLGAWPELMARSIPASQSRRWWEISGVAVRRAIDELTTGELTAIENALFVQACVRAAGAKGVNGRLALDSLRLMGPEAGRGARQVVDAWWWGKYPRRVPREKGCVFLWLPGGGREFLDEIIERVRAEPSRLETEPFILEWVLAQRGTIADLIEPMESFLRPPLRNQQGDFYELLGMLPLPAQDAVRIPRLAQFEPKIGPMQLGYVLPRAGVADQFLADYREALLNPDPRLSSALVGIARTGPAMAELEPEIETALASANEDIQFQAFVALAMVGGRHVEIERLVFDTVRAPGWGSMTQVSAASGRSRWRAKGAAVAALCSGAWPKQVACDVLIEAAKQVTPNEMPVLAFQAIEYILMDVEQSKRHQSALNAALCSNPWLAGKIAHRVRLYRGACMLATGFDDAAAATTAPLDRRLLRSAAAEARAIMQERAER